MTVKCGVRFGEGDVESVTDVDFGRVPTQEETVFIFGKLYKVAGVTWPVTANNRYESPGGPIVETIYSAIHPIIDVVLMWEEEE